MAKEGACETFRESIRTMTPVRWMMGKGKLFAEANNTASCTSLRLSLGKGKLFAGMPNTLPLVYPCH
jgi:hypothetical protein